MKTKTQITGGTQVDDRIVVRLLKSWFFWSLLFVTTIGLALMHRPLVEAFPFGAGINAVLDALLSHELRDKLGDALIIAALLSVLLDRYLKLELLHEAAHDLLSFAAGHGLPKGMQDVIGDILRQPFARKNFAMEVRISLASTGYVQLVMETKYDVYNLTTGAQNYEIQSATSARTSRSAEIRCCR